VSEHEEDFAAMFEASEKARQFKRGQQIEGTIVGIGSKVAFVDIGGKGEAEIDIAELKDADGRIEASVGERITAIIVSTGGGITLSCRGVRNAATQRELEDAFRSGVAVEGKVVSANKGGFEVRIARGPSAGSGSPRAESRGERAFCPLSQIDIIRTDDPNVHVGKTYAFRIIEYKNDGKDVVLSRRRLLEEQQRADAAEARKAIVPDAVITGRVASVVDFGAFVDLGGGVQGLLHVSEMGWSRVTNPNEIVAPGDQITVKVLRVDETTQKISLGLRQLQDDPWSTVSTKYEAGKVYRGRISRIADFGVFVELDPEFTGLIPVAETGVDRNMDLRKAFQVGTPIDVVVLEVDASSRRIRLSKTAVAEQQEQAEVREYAARAEATGPSVSALAEKLRGALGGGKG
jgi:small subunit ribosomal protein S1